MGYENRSKAAHDAFRVFITEAKWTREEGEEIAGTITLLYYLDKPGLLNHIVEAQHKFGNIVLSSMHLHLSENKCMEVIAVNGKATDVKSLSRELMTKKGVKQLKLTVMAP
jgi:CopG family nickel-responsive transcriptional regulator